MREVAFHCTNTDPSLMINGGFKSFEKGFNGANYAAHFYKRFLPENPLLVSSIGAPVWDYDAKFCMKIDITGLEKFPDFGHLLEYGAHLDEECFQWENEDELRRWKVFGDPVQKKLAKFVLDECVDLTMCAADFTGDMSYSILETCAIDGDKLTPERVISTINKTGKLDLAKTK